MKGFILYYKTIHKFSDIEKWDEEKQDAETEFEITVVMQNQPVYDDYLQYITSSSNRVHDEESLKQYQRQLRAIVQRAIDAVEPAELQRLKAEYDEQHLPAPQPTRAASMLFRQTVGDTLNDRCDFVAFMLALLDFWGEKSVLGVIEDLVHALSALPLKHDRTVKLLVGSLKRIATAMPDTSAAESQAQYNQIMKSAMDSMTTEQRRLVRLLETKVGLGHLAVFDLVFESAMRRLLAADDVSDETLMRVAQTNRAELLQLCSDWVATPAQPEIDRWRKQWNKLNAAAGQSSTQQDLLGMFLESVLSHDY